MNENSSNNGLKLRTMSDLIERQRLIWQRRLRERRDDMKTRMERDGVNPEMASAMMLAQFARDDA